MKTVAAPLHPIVKLLSGIAGFALGYALMCAFVFFFISGLPVAVDVLRWLVVR